MLRRPIFGCCSIAPRSARPARTLCCAVPSFIAAYVACVPKSASAVRATASGWVMTRICAPAPRLAAVAPTRASIWRRWPHESIGNAKRAIYQLIDGPFGILEVQALALACAADCALAVVDAFSELLNHLAIKGWDVGRFAACHDTLVAHHLLIDPVCAGIFEISLDRLV